jgi:ABC-type oligopeptide transport system substrate-binding subunit
VNFRCNRSRRANNQIKLGAFGAILRIDIEAQLSSGPFDNRPDQKDQKIRHGQTARVVDFGIVVASWPESLTPGNELRDYWGSRATATPGSCNLIGIADKAIDQLIDRIVYATNRAEQVGATHALDRVLLWHHYVVPQWSLN